MRVLTKSQILKKYFETLGLTRDEASLCDVLLRKGKMTVLALAKETGVNRTTSYRLLEQLKKMGLISHVVDERRVLVELADTSSFELLVKEREAEVKFLKEFYPAFSSFVHFSQIKGQPETKVLFYRGVEGIKQMIWNVLKAKKEVVGYSYLTIETVVGEVFTNDWLDEFRSRNLELRDILSDAYVESKKKLNKSIVFDEPHFHSRYIPIEILDINHQMDIYNEVTSFYNWHEGEIFGVEIYNEKIAKMHKQLFEIVWGMGKQEL